MTEREPDEPAEREGVRAAQRRRTRAAILAAARARFIATGYERATIREIADAAGVAVGSVHAHFRDKEALLLACFYANIHAALARIWEDEGAASSAPLVDQLTRCGRILYEAYAAHVELSKVMIRATLFRETVAADDPLEPFLARIAGLYRAARDRGELRRLPGDGLVAAEAFIAFYFAVLVAGLSGYYGVDDRPEDAAARWAAHLRGHLALHIEGLGAGAGAEEETR